MGALSKIEEATLKFYQWDIRNRGYIRFSSPVKLEPPFLPFSSLNENGNQFDDGRVPSLFKLIVLWILSWFIKAPKREYLTEIPFYDVTEHLLVRLKLVAPPQTEIRLASNLEFLNILSTTKHAVSFEITAFEGQIIIEFVVSEDDNLRVQGLVRSYFPEIEIVECAIEDDAIDYYTEAAIADFGLEQESMIPIFQPANYTIDPLTSIIAELSLLQTDELARLQIIVEGTNSPWHWALTEAVSDGDGGSFFYDNPDIPKWAQDKISSPLFAVAFRIVVEGKNKTRSREIARNLIETIKQVSASDHNRLIPLANDGYPYEDHLRCVIRRQSNRFGVLLSAKELATFIHYPNKSIINPKLRVQFSKTKATPPELKSGTYLLGRNNHLGLATDVYLNDEQRLHHMEILGATGVGKSTLIAHLMLQDIVCGNGCTLIDPHGDIVDDVLQRIPEERVHDVIIIDPSHTDYVIGFNILEAKSEIEKAVLSSDIVSAFKRYATAWGDNMSAVLQNAVTTFLELEHGGTILELRRFLTDDTYRSGLLKNLEDHSLRYFWEQEYSYHKKNIGPLLTRMDIFLRSRIIRNMVAQNGLNISDCMSSQKIVLIKLSQGLIGEENSRILGTLLIAKFYQAALGRQSLSIQERLPYYLYIDECHHFITPSISLILSGARKYGLGLILAHQEMSQIDDSKIENSIRSNAGIKVCFRLGDSDAKSFESHFSGFERTDFLGLQRGQAICSVGGSEQDFSLETINLTTVFGYTDDVISQINENSKKQYGSTRQDIEQKIETFFTLRMGDKKLPEKPNQGIDLDISHLPDLTESLNEVRDAEKTPTSFDEQKEKLLNLAQSQEVERLHRRLQVEVRTVAQNSGYAAHIEKQLQDGLRVDVSLHRGEESVAVEISVTNSIEYEIGNIQKALEASYGIVFCLCENSKHLSNIQSRFSELYADKAKNVLFGSLSDFKIFMQRKLNTNIPIEKRVRGYRVTSKRVSEYDGISEDKENRLKEIILSSMK